MQQHLIFAVLKQTRKGIFICRSNSSTFPSTLEVEIQFEVSVR